MDADLWDTLLTESHRAIVVLLAVATVSLTAAVTTANTYEWEPGLIVASTFLALTYLIEGMRLIQVRSMALRYRFRSHFRPEWRPQFGEIAVEQWVLYIESSLTTTVISVVTFGLFILTEYDQDMVSWVPRLFVVGLILGAGMSAIGLFRPKLWMNMDVEGLLPWLRFWKKDK